MQTIQSGHIQRGYRGLSLLVDLNADRIMFLATITAALLAGAYIGSI